MKNRIGERREMKNGLLAKIIAYRSSKDMDVKFLGVLRQECIVRNAQYSNFCRGKIRCPMIFMPAPSEPDTIIMGINPNTRTGFYIDTEDLPLVKDFMWSEQNGYNQNNYVGLLHRLLLTAPDNLLVDHINGDRRDNRKENLRLCVAAENTRNKSIQKNNQSGLKGVSKRGNYYIARISHNGKPFYLGTYKTKEKAARVYNRAAQKFHGEFARLNELEG